MPRWSRRRILYASTWLTITDPRHNPANPIRKIIVENDCCGRVKVYKKTSPWKGSVLIEPHLLLLSTRSSKHPSIHGFGQHALEQVALPTCAAYPHLYQKGWSKQRGRELVKDICEYYCSCCLSETGESHVPRSMLLKLYWQCWQGWKVVQG